AEWRAPGGPDAAPSWLTLNEVMVAFWAHPEHHYRHPDGTPTSELNEYRRSLRPVKELYGHTPAAEFGPLALKAVRQRLVFKWAVSEELVPHGVYAALATVAGLAKGRSPARET